MASDKKKPRAVIVDDRTWYKFLTGSNVKMVAAAAAAVAAVLYLDDAVFRPVYTSGPLPVAARAEVDKLRTDVFKSIDVINKMGAENLELAKVARREAQQAAQQSADNRLDRLLAQKIELEARIAATPNDPILTRSLARTNIDIQQLLGQAQLTTTTTTTTTK